MRNKGLKKAAAETTCSNIFLLSAFHFSEYRKSYEANIQAE